MAPRKDPIDTQPSLQLEFWPNTVTTVATVVVGTRDRDGYHRTVLARWHLRVRRADLVGHSTESAVTALIAGLLRRIEDGPDPADWFATQPVRDPASGPGAPTGGQRGRYDVELPLEFPQPPGLPPAGLRD